jgi:hypothetical protein
VASLAGEPAAPVVDTPPQADDQTRNQNADVATKSADGSAVPKVKSEKERTSCYTYTARGFGHWAQ